MSSLKEPKNCPECGCKPSFNYEKEGYSSIDCSNDKCINHVRFITDTWDLKSWNELEVNRDE